MRGEFKPAFVWFGPGIGFEMPTAHRLFNGDCRAEQTAKERKTNRLGVDRSGKKAHHKVSTGRTDKEEASR